MRRVNFQDECRAVLTVSTGRTVVLAAVVALLAAMLAMGLLGAVLTFAGQAVYAPHFYTTLAWGMTPLEDQQAAGLIMWAPASALYLFAALAVLGRMLGPTREVAA